MRLLAIDPGKNTGWALFQDKTLKCAGRGDPLKGAPGHTSMLVVIETPRWYPRERDIDVNDLLDLSVMVGRYQGRFEICSKVELVFPRAWKGSVPWDICCRRVLAALTSQEAAVLPMKRGAKREPDDPEHYKNFAHDVLDAVGIGLWRIGRFK